MVLRPHSVFSTIAEFNAKQLSRAPRFFRHDVIENAAVKAERKSY